MHKKPPHFLLPAAAAIFLMAGGALSAELRDVVVEKEDKRYRLTSETRFDASVADLYRVLTDYDLFTEFSSVFVESRNLRAAANGKPRYFTRMEGCMLLFCKSFVRIGDPAAAAMKAASVPIPSSALAAFRVRHGHDDHRCCFTVNACRARSTRRCGVA